VVDSHNRRRVGSESTPSGQRIAADLRKPIVLV
jgi:hypothetical protein